MRVTSLRITVLTAIVFCTLSGRESAVRAQGSAGAILVIGVMADRHLDSHLTAHLERYLRSTERVISSRELRGEERNCREPRCLYDLAQRKGAAMLIGANVTHTDKNEVELGLYLMLSASKTWRRADVIVASDQLDERLSQLTRKLLQGPLPERSRLGLQTPQLGPRLPVPDILMKVLAALPEERRVVSLARKRLGASMLALGGLALGAAAVVSILGSQYNVATRCFGGYRSQCVDHGTPVAIGGYALGGGIAMAGTLTLLLPERRKGGL